MQRRGFATATILSLSLATGLSMGAFFSGWGWVDVQSKGEDAVHIAMPIPMDLLPIACAFLPEETYQEGEFQEFLQYKEAALRLLESLRECPNACLVNVQSPEANVKITKEGDRLRISVQSPDADVNVTMPLGPVLRALKALHDPTSKVTA